jgi:hypothetical protein
VIEFIKGGYAMFAMLPKLFISNYKTWLPAAIIIILVIYHFTYVHILKSDIKDAEGLAEYRRTLIKDYEYNKTLAEIEIATLNSNNNNLKSAIQNTNEAIDKLKLNEKQLVDEVEKWKNKTPEVVVKYVRDVIKSKSDSNVTCEEYKNANESIARIKYEDL